MKKSRSVLAVTADEKPKDLLDPGLCSRSYTAGSMLGTDLRRGRRRLSSSLQVPPWRPLDRARSPEPDSVQRPTTLPLCIPPRIAITHAEPDRRFLTRPLGSRVYGAKRALGLPHASSPQEPGPWRSRVQVAPEPSLVQ
ncbi:hypothetical protein KIL84_020716 [Mauremys mutica]|uniref:Uncharacterized protein n=1 Tax=Mauremys mutica TaxID=74926 RepID=A0A9D3XAM8_9SAUR|nr:hypothetical protein KIL84_020716 [Mauremys mutica]